MSKAASTPFFTTVCRLLSALELLIVLLIIFLKPQTSYQVMVAALLLGVIAYQMALRLLLKEVELLTHRCPRDGACDA